MTFTVYAPRVDAHPTRTGVRRDVGAIRLLVIHTSEGGELPTSAEGLARYISTPRTATNLASYHYIADHDRVIPIVPDDYVAYANAGANHDGLSICHPGRAGQTAAQWADGPSSAQCEQVARWLADKSAEHGIPLAKVGPAEIVRGARGVCGHVDVTHAYRRSTHTDPGPHYPWDRVLDRARQLASPPVTPTIPVLVPDSEEDDMAAQALVSMDNDPAVFQVFNGYKTWCPNGPAVGAAERLAALAGKTLRVQVFRRGVADDVALFEAMGPVIGPLAAGLDQYGIRR